MPIAVSYTHLDVYKRQERGWLKKTFKRAMDKELREHKSSFIVFYILRALVIVSLAVSYTHLIGRGNPDAAEGGRRGV